MALPCSFLVALVLLSCHSLCCLACHLPDTHCLRNWRVLTLLGQMRRLSAGPCVNYTNDFAFPKELFDGQQLQEAQALSVVHGMTQNVFHLFCMNMSSAPWNMTLLEELCSGLSEQVDDLDSCLLQEARLAEAPLLHEDSTLRTYFQRISLYLQDKNHSPCAWEMVQAEIGRSFFSSAFLQERIRWKKSDQV
ncbi:interferon alpha-1/2-like [Canis lupus dingo]|uniref:Interferon alpha-1/2-like n=1 Tax=Canis lupus dingo TaxID=286419 RepID=A0A8C0KLA3_CANLU|nr:interferon alpha-1/2-like [Canis lupus dingo]